MQKKPGNDSRTLREWRVEIALEEHLGKINDRSF